LTAPNPDFEDDVQLFKNLGLKTKPAFKSAELLEEQ
jgi:hypothetical protein